MGGRGASYDAARQIVGQYSLSDITASKSKIVSFFRDVDKNGGIRVEDGRIKVKKDTMNKAQDLARDLSGSMVERNEQAEQDFRDIRQMLRGNYALSDQDRSNIPDFGAYVRSSENFLSIRKEGKSIDSAYQELAEMYPYYFNADRVTNPADQLQDINRVLGELKNSTQALPRDEREYAAADLRDALIRGYIAKQNRRRSA